MTEISRKKEEAKKAIRSLLLSAPVGLTLDELKRDYVEFIGTQLPGRNLGYNGCEDFLQDLPDVIAVSWKNGQMVLSAVANESTKHIQKLVSNQKVDSKKKWGALGRQGRRPLMPPRNFNTNRAPPRRNYNTTNTYIGQSYRGFVPPRQPNFSHAHHRTMPVVPAFIRNQIHQLVSNYRNGVPLKDFGVVYQHRFGMHLDPRRIGFKDVPDLISNVKDLVSVLQYQGESRVLPAGASLPHPDKDTKYSSHNKQPQHFDAGVPNEKWQNHNLPSPGKAALLPDPSPKSDKFKDRSVVSNSHEDEKVPFVLTNGSYDINDTCNVPNTVQDRMRQLMRIKSKGIFASQLLVEYKKQFSCSLNTQAYGYNSVIEFASDLNHILKIQRPNPQGDWLLLPIQAESIAPDSASVESEQVSNIPGPAVKEVEAEVKEALIQVLSVHTSGIMLSKFLDVFQDMTGMVLNIDQYCEGGLKPFLHSLSHILYIKLDVFDNAKVCLLKHDGPRRFHHLKDKYKPIAIGKQEQSQAADLHIPPDAVTPGCFYKPQYLPAFAPGQNRYVDLYVSNVINPGLMWIQLRGPETTLALEDLMDEINLVYNDKVATKTYRMRPGFVKCGLPCVAIYPQDGNWYRAIITGIEDQLYEVFYVDYGNSCLVSIDHMQMIKTQLLELPAQAIQARLSNIQPIQHTWKRGTQKRLLELCAGKPLVGLVTGIQDRLLSLSLVDTTGTEDIHINDLMVNEEYARIMEDESSHRTKETPSTHFLYGSNVPLATETNGSVSEEPNRRYVRQAQVTDDQTWNLINIADELYLMSAEVSSLFFKDNIISMKLSQSKTDVPQIVVSKDDFSDLFSELMKYDVPSVQESTRLLSLYPLKSLPLLLEIFGKDKDLDEVKDTTLEILEWFDPNDPFWKGDDDGFFSEDCDKYSEAESQGSKDSGSTNPPLLEDLQVVLNVLQIKRQRIITKLMDPQGCAEDVVNELSDVELNIKRIQAVIRKQKEENGEPKSPPVSQFEKKMETEKSQSNGVQSSAIPPAVSSISPSNQVLLPTVKPATDMNALLQQQMMLNSGLMAQMKTSPYQRLLASTAQQSQGLPMQSMDQQAQLFQQMYPFQNFSPLALNPYNMGMLNPGPTLGGFSSPLVQSQSLLMQSQLLQAQIQAQTQLLAQLQKKDSLTTHQSVPSSSLSDHALTNRLNSLNFGSNGNTQGCLVSNQMSSTTTSLSSASSNDCASTKKQ